MPTEKGKENGEKAARCVCVFKSGENGSHVAIFPIGSNNSSQLLKRNCLAACERESLFRADAIVETPFFTSFNKKKLSLGPLIPKANKTAFSVYSLQRAP